MSHSTKLLFVGKQGNKTEKRNSNREKREKKLKRVIAFYATKLKLKRK